MIQHSTLLLLFLVVAAVVVIMLLGSCEVFDDLSVRKAEVVFLKKLYMLTTGRWSERAKPKYTDHPYKLNTNKHNTILKGKSMT